MGYSLRVQALLKKQRLEKQEQRQRERAEAERLAEEFHRDYADRERTAALLGVSVHRLKRMMAAKIGPAPLKMGTAKQAKVLWETAEIRRYLENPAAYEAEKRMPSPD